MQGWIKLHRKFLQNSIFRARDPLLIQLTVYILLKANHRQEKVLINDTEVIVNAGQGIFGIFQIVKDLTGLEREGSREFKRFQSLYYRRLKILEKIGFLKNESTNKFTVISIINWDVYQSNEKQTENETEEFVSEKKRSGVKSENEEQEQSIDLSSKSESQEVKNGKQTENKRKTKGSKSETNKNNKNDKNIYMCGLFDVFWGIYPRKVNRKGAFRNWNTQIKTKKQDPEMLIQATKNYAFHCKVKRLEDDKIMHPTTFLGRDDRFVDFKDLHLKRGNQEQALTRKQIIEMNRKKFEGGNDE